MDTYSYQDGAMTGRLDMLVRFILLYSVLPSYLHPLLQSRLQVGDAHLLSHQESTAEDVLSVTVEIQSAKDNDGALLNRHHRVHPHLLHHDLARCQGQGQIATHHPLWGEDNWLQSSYSSGPVCIQDPEQRRKDCGWPLSPWTQSFQASPLWEEVAVNQNQNLMP